jgi:hypothetical protein
MTATQQKNKTELKKLQDIEVLISDAIKKVGGTDENDLCRFLPGKTGGYMHHFTLRKMKTKDSSELKGMINEFITDVESPVSVPAKRRAPRGSRKRRDQITFSKNELDHMLRIARLAGDKTLIRKLTPKKDLKTLKQELIATIKLDEVDQDLWESYCEVIHALNNPEAAANLLASTIAAATNLNVTPIV